MRTTIPKCYCISSSLWALYFLMLFCKQEQRTNVNSNISEQFTHQYHHISLCCDFPIRILKQLREPQNALTELQALPEETEPLVTTIQIQCCCVQLHLKCEAEMYSLETALRAGQPTDWLQDIEGNLQLRQNL